MAKLYKAILRRQHTGKVTGVLVNHGMCALIPWNGEKTIDDAKKIEDSILYIEKEIIFKNLSDPELISEW